MSESAGAHGAVMDSFVADFSKKKKKRKPTIASVAYLFAHFFLYGGEVKSPFFFVAFVYEQYSPLLTFRFWTVWFSSLFIPSPPSLKPKIIKRRRRAGWQRWPQSVPGKRERCRPLIIQPSHENSNTSSQKYGNFVDPPKTNFYIPLFCFSQRNWWQTSPRLEPPIQSTKWIL